MNATATDTATDACEARAAALAEAGDVAAAMRLASAIAVCRDAGLKVTLDTTATEEEVTK